MGRYHHHGKGSSDDNDDNDNRAKEQKMGPKDEEMKTKSQKLVDWAAAQRALGSHFSLTLCLSFCLLDVGFGILNHYYNIRYTYRHYPIKIVSKKDNITQPTLI